MPRKIRVLWIEDNYSALVKEMIDVVKFEIDQMMFDVEVFEVNNLTEANEYFESKYIDIIFSDYELEANVKGLDYLLKLRGNNILKHYVLYSNNDQNMIASEVVNKFNENKKMKLFSNFNFFSTQNYENELEDVITHFVNNKSRIEELRTAYILFNSKIDDILDVKGTVGNNYCERINNYLANCSNDPNKIRKIKVLWHEVRIVRNALAHGKQEFCNSEWMFYINGNAIVVDVNEFKKYLKKLKDLEQDLSDIDRDFFNSTA